MVNPQLNELHSLKYHLHRARDKMNEWKGAVPYDAEGDLAWQEAKRHMKTVVDLASKSDRCLHELVLELQMRL